MAARTVLITGGGTGTGRVARMIVFLAGDDESFITGGVHSVDRGMAAL